MCRIKYLSVFFIVLIVTACQSGHKETSKTDTGIKNKQSSLPSSLSLVKDASVVTSKLAVPYKKFELDNGLTVVLHEDHSDPLVHVDVTYHVGSSREEPGKSGFAHFFEHMMFQGSENVADEQHFKIVTEAGGEMNGTTNNDRTNYYQTVPANQLEKVLWLESDRMGFLLDAVTQDKFEVQRETVKNERAQRVDNQPYGLRRERISEALYPKDHPYSWPVIGYIEDLNRVDVNDLKAFFSRWYGPNNAVLTIGGAIDEEQTLDWIVKYFGSIPKGPEVEKLPKAPVKLNENRYLTLEDDVHLPLIQITFPTVHVRHEDEAPLDVLSDILGGGKNSLFYKNLVKDGWAVHAGVGHPCSELACQFELIALPNPQRLQSLQQLEKIMQDTLEEFEQRGVNDDDLLRTKATIRAGTVFGLQSVAGKISTLASNQIFSDEPDMLQFDANRYAGVTKQDVMRVFKQYIQGKAAVTLSIVPDGQIAMQAHEPNFEPPTRSITPPTAQFEQTDSKPVDNFDRSKMPTAGANPVAKIPEFWKTNLSNGMSVTVHETTETPTTMLVISMEGGPLLDPREKAGLASMTAAMMSETTQNYSNEDMANELAKLGSGINFSAGGRFTTISVSTLEENFDATLALLNEKLFYPAFKESDFERLKARTIQGLQQGLKNPQTLSHNALLQVLYGEENRIGVSDGGTVQSISSISLADVKEFYKKYYNSSLASAIVVGQVSEKSLAQQLKFLAAWKSKDYAIPPYKQFPENIQKSLFVVNDPEAAQSIVTFVKPSLPYDAEGEHFRSKLLNFPFGGAFNSRINLNLREDKGFSYGVRSGFSGGKTLGRFQAGGAINKEHTIAALDELLAEMASYSKTGMTTEELEFMRNAYTQGDALNYETPGNKAQFLRHMSVYGLDKDFPTRQNQIIAEISLKELNALAEQQFDADSMQIVLVADMNTLGEAITQWAERQNRKIIDLTR